MGVLPAARGMTIDPGACAQRSEDPADDLGREARAVSGRQEERRGRAVRGPSSARPARPIPSSRRAGCAGAMTGGPGLPGGLGHGRALGRLGGGVTTTTGLGTALAQGRDDAADERLAVERQAAAWAGPSAGSCPRRGRWRGCGWCS